MYAATFVLITSARSAVCTSPVYFFYWRAAKTKLMSLIVLSSTSNCECSSYRTVAEAVGVSQLTRAFGGDSVLTLDYVGVDSLHTLLVLISTMRPRAETTTPSHLKVCSTNCAVL